MKKKLIFKFSLLCSVSIMLAACGTAPQAVKPELSSSPSQIDSALKKAAANADLQGDKGQGLKYAERIYARDTANAESAIKYAAALREANYANKASVVLAPFANDPQGPAIAKTEYAAIQLALGNSETAEKYAQRAILQNPNDGRAYQYLGIALDSQSKHPEAERAFRKGLDLWQGDPTPIMNNLALNLSSQGYLEEASEILLRAKTLSPNRIEVERNLRIINALRQSENPTTPKPVKRPSI